MFATLFFNVYFFLVTSLPSFQEKEGAKISAKVTSDETGYESQTSKGHENVGMLYSSHQVLLKMSVYWIVLIKFYNLDGVVGASFYHINGD